MWALPWSVSWLLERLTVAEFTPTARTNTKDMATATTNFMLSLRLRKDALCSCRSSVRFESWLTTEHKKCVTFLKKPKSTKLKQKKIHFIGWPWLKHASCSVILDLIGCETMNILAFTATYYWKISVLTSLFYAFAKRNRSYEVQFSLKPWVSEDVACLKTETT